MSSSHAASKKLYFSLIAKKRQGGGKQMQEKQMPESRKKCDLIPIYKEREDVRSCGSYRSVKLLEHGMKVIERIFEKWLRNVRIDEMQMGVHAWKRNYQCYVSTETGVGKMQNSRKEIVCDAC